MALSFVIGIGGAREIAEKWEQAVIAKGGFGEITAPPVDFITTASDILKDALALPDEARAALASRLVDSLDPQSEPRSWHFAQARRRALKRLREGLDLQWVPDSREEIHRP